MIKRKTIKRGSKMIKKKKQVIRLIDRLIGILFFVGLLISGCGAILTVYECVVSEYILEVIKYGVLAIILWIGFIYFAVEGSRELDKKK
jgi:hypothetical protein